MPALVDLERRHPGFVVGQDRTVGGDVDWTGGSVLSSEIEQIFLTTNGSIVAAPLSWNTPIVRAAIAAAVTAITRPSITPTATSRRIARNARPLGSSPTAIDRMITVIR